MNDINKYLLYEFKDRSLIKAALNHPSLNEESNDFLTYEKLEFLGDTVLSLVITNFLILKYKKEKEGALAKRRAYLVSGKILVKIANQIKLGNFINMSQGEESSGGRSNKNNLENCLEALIGAMYLDGGLDICTNFIHKYWIPIAQEISIPPDDPKSALQEWSQKLGKPIPIYKVVKVEGPAHQPEFTVIVKVQDMDEIEAKGASKKIAQINAARILIDKIRNNHE